MILQHYQLILFVIVLTHCRTSVTSFLAPVKTMKRRDSVMRTVDNTHYSLLSRSTTELAAFEKSRRQAFGQGAVLLSSIIGISSAGVASAQDVVVRNIEKGSKLFDANCAACHVNGENAIAKDKTLKKDALQKYFASDPVGIQEFVQNGLLHRGAFMFGDKLSDSDFTDVTAYVLSQATSDKW